MSKSSSNFKRFSHENIEVEIHPPPTMQSKKINKTSIHPLMKNHKFTKKLQKSVAAIRLMRKTIKKMKDQYDPFKTPPDWELAEIHQQATKVGTEESHEVDEERKLCICCGYSIEKKEVNLIEPTENLSFLGSGYPLYFHFLQNTIWLLLTLLVISGEFNIISNYISQNCIVLTDEQKLTNNDKNGAFCVSDWITIFSLVNKTNELGLNEIQHYLNFAGLIGVIIFILHYRKSQKDLYLQCNWKETTPADYTIAVKNIPRHVSMNVEKELFDYFSNIDNKEYKVKNINLCYDLKERAKLQQSLHKLLDKKRKMVKEKNNIENIDREIMFKEKEMRDYDVNIQKNQLQFCGIAFISFDTQKEKTEIIKKSRLSLFDRIKIFLNKNFQLSQGFVFHGSRLIIEQAPEPNEIIFNNLSIETKERLKLRAIILFLTALEMISFGALIYYLLSFQYNYFNKKMALLEIKYDDSQSNESLSEYNTMMIYLYFMNGCISLVIVVINNIFIALITEYIVKIGKYSTYTRKKISLASKLSIILFFNNAILVYLICEVNDQISTSGGLIYTQYYVFIFNAITPLFTKVIDFPFQIKRIKLYIYKKYFKDKLTQIEANKLLQYPKYEIETYYAETVQTILFTAFYSALLPFGIVWSVLSLTLLYVHHKRSLLRKRSVTKVIGGSLSKFMTSMLELAIIMTALSNFLFEYEILNSTMTIDIIGLAISVTYFFAPTTWLIEHLFYFKELSETKKYSDIFHKFITNYNIENPVTSYKALKQKLNFEIVKDVEKIRMRGSREFSKEFNSTIRSLKNGDDDIPLKKKKTITSNKLAGFIRIQKLELLRKFDNLNRKYDTHELQIINGDIDILTQHSQASFVIEEEKNLESNSKNKIKK